MSNYFRLELPATDLTPGPADFPGVWLLCIIAAGAPGRHDQGRLGRGGGHPLTCAVGRPVGRGSSGAVQRDGGREQRALPTLGERPPRQCLISRVWDDDVIAVTQKPRPTV